MAFLTVHRGREAPGGLSARRLAAGLLRLVELPMLPVVVVLFLWFMATVPGFGTTANLDTMARVAAPLLIASIGATLIILTGGIDLSVGAVMSLASVVGAMVMRDTGSVPLGLGAGMAMGLAIGILNGLAVAWLRLSPFVHTLAMLLTARAIAFLISRGYSIGRLPPEATAFGRSGVLGVPTLLVVALALTGLFLVLLNRTSFGRSVFLIGSNERAAVFNGIGVPRIKFLLYLIGSVLGAVAGMVAVLRLGSGAPVLGDSLLLQVIAAVVVGGTSVFGGEGGLLRTLTGVVLITILDKGLDLMGLPFFDQAIVIGLVILVGSSFGTWLRNRKIAQKRTVTERPSRGGPAQP